jgi:IMP dehydrogenase
MLKEYFTFDDVLITPKFSTVASRRDVELTTDLGGGLYLKLPVISANMESITEESMADTMYKNGGLGILHRFCTIERNIEIYRNTRVEIAQDGEVCPPLSLGVSIGITDNEKERAEALIYSGADLICIDVANGAQQSVVDQVKWLRSLYKDNIYIMVGNFATASSITAFNTMLTWSTLPNSFKVGIGPGSVCETRTKTGVGIPQLSAILDCVSTGVNIIADGGMKTPGCIAKALGAGAKAVMLGGMLSGTDETTSFSVNGDTRSYNGSASGNYAEGWKTSEGVKVMVPNKGPVKLILKDIEGGLRSSFTYTNSSTLEEFQQNCEFIKVSTNTVIENRAHIKDLT